jgi:hypothetical protein
MLIAAFSLLLIPFLLLYGTWAWAVVLKSVWLWFVVPAFALQPITFVQAIAISAIVNIFFIKSTIATHKHDNKKLEEINWDPLVSAIITAAVAPWITMAIYWFIQAIFI